METLETRNIDSLDFPDEAVWTLRRLHALNAGLSVIQDEAVVDVVRFVLFQ